MYQCGIVAVWCYHSGETLAFKNDMIAFLFSSD